MYWDGKKNTLTSSTWNGIFCTSKNWHTSDKGQV